MFTEDPAIRTVEAFINELKTLFTLDARRVPSREGILLQASSLLPDKTTAVSNIIRTTLPVTNIFQTARQLPCVPRLFPLLDTIKSIEPFCSWQQNPGYSRDSLGEYFMNNYGYFQVIGPGGLVQSQDVAVGVLLLGQKVHYPEHAHPATEVYYPLCGEALWSQGVMEPTLRSSGDIIYHTSHETHAMETVDQPLLALYVWIGDVSIPAQLTSGSALFIGRE